MDTAKLKELIFNVLAVSFFGVTAYIILTDASFPAAGRGSVALLSAALCAVLGNPSRLEIVKHSLSGIEPKTRAIVSEAERGLAAVHDLAATTGRLLVELIASEGRLGGEPTYAEKQAQKAHIFAALRDIGIPEKKIAEAAEADYRWNVVDYVYAITKPVQDRTPRHNYAEWNAFVQQNFQGFERPEPDVLVDFITQLGLMDDETRERIEDYRHYLETRSHRRPDVWVRGVATA